MKKIWLISVFISFIFIFSFFCGCAENSEKDLEFGKWEMTGNSGLSEFNGVKYISFVEGDFYLKTSENTNDGMGSYTLNEGTKILYMEIDWVKLGLDKLDGKYFTFRYEFEGNKLILNDAQGSGSLTLER